MILPHAPKTQTLFIVDDSEFTLNAMSRVLNKEFNVMVARTGDEALEKIKESQPDLVLLDVMMPGMSGIDVCSKLKASDHTKHIPIIFTTSLSELHFEEYCLRIGAADFITKPFNFNIFLLRIKNVLKNGCRK